MSNNNTNQPLAVNNNIVQVIWNDIQCEYLINQRISRNNEFWSLGRGGKALFWNEIKNQINEIFGTNFTDEQVKKKWNNLKNDYMVSIFYF